MSKPTPGPWVVQHFVKVMAGGKDQPLMVIASGEDIVADVHRERDASLIASAPDLLSALRGAVDVLQSQMGFLQHAEDIDLIDAARAAIAKATGAA